MSAPHRDPLRAHPDNSKERRRGSQVIWIKPPPELHAEIRSAEACLRSSTMAVDLAKRFGSRLHVLHLTTEVELDLFQPGPLESKRITGEVCIHHLYFDDSWYARKGADIKCNPAIKRPEDQRALRQALVDDRVDVIATDHAPHTRAGERLGFSRCPGWTSACGVRTSMPVRAGKVRHSFHRDCRCKDCACAGNSIQCKGSWISP